VLYESYITPAFNIIIINITLIAGINENKRNTCPFNPLKNIIVYPKIPIYNRSWEKNVN
jgi:hypothetical protein